jgi:hypothetical protein
MRGPLSSQSHVFSISPLCIGTPNPDRRIGYFYLCAPFGRQSHASKTHRHPRARLATLCCSRLVVFVSGNDASPRFRTGGFSCRGRACIGPGLARDACDRLLYVSAHISASADSRPKHHNLYSPTGDPPKPGTGTTLLSRGGLSASPFTLRSPGPVLDATLPSFPLFRLLSSCSCVINLFAWGSGVGSAGVQPMRNTQVDGAPKVPSAGGNCLRRCLLTPPPFPILPPPPAGPADFKPRPASLFCWLTWSAIPPTSLLRESHHVPDSATEQ